MNLTAHVARRIARRMERDGFACSEADVWTVYEHGTLEGRESLASRILGEMDDYEVLAPHFPSYGTPALVPTSDGAVQVECHSDGWNMECHVRRAK